MDGVLLEACDVTQHAGHLGRHHNRRKNILHTFANSKK